MSLLRAFSFCVRGMSRAPGCPRSVMRMTFPAFALATHTLARCRSSRIPIFSTIRSVAHHVLHYGLRSKSPVVQRLLNVRAYGFQGMDHCDVSELAAELAQVTCGPAGSRVDRRRHAWSRAWGPACGTRAGLGAPITTSRCGGRGLCSARP